MKLSNANNARSRYLAGIIKFLSELGEDVGQVGSNVCNFPFVEDEEEGVMEITVKVVKKPYDECMQEREDYVHHVAEQAEKKAQKEAEKQKKIAKQEAQKKKKAEE